MQYNRPVYTRQLAHDPRQDDDDDDDTLSQPKRRPAADTNTNTLRVNQKEELNPDTNTEVHLSSTQSTSSGVSSTTRHSDHPDTLGKPSDKDNPIAMEFKEKVHGSMKPAHNAIIKSPTDTKAPVSTVDQSLDTPSLEHVADEVDMSEPDRLAEQPTATLPPEVTQSNEGDSTVGAASVDSYNQLL